MIFDIYIATVPFIGAIIGALATNYFLYKRYKVERRDTILHELYSKYIESIAGGDHRGQLLLKAKIVILGSDSVVRKMAEMDEIAGDLQDRMKRQKFLNLIIQIRKEISPIKGAIDQHHVSTILLNPLKE